jgi:3'(2'),5'-bisphosphate nucleotidase
MAEHSPEFLLPALVDIALKAGRVIMEVYAQDFEEIKKADGSPVTIADQRAEALIIEGLVAVAQGVPIVAEEEVAAGRTPAIGKQFFLVDPLDGTRDFLEKSDGEFTVNIGLIDGGVPVAGVVYAPAIGELYYGAAGKAWRQQCDVRTATPTGAKLPLRVLAGAEGALRMLTSKRAKSNRLEAFSAALGGHQHDRMSSSIKFIKIATGEADLYPRFGQVSEWDAAAADAVLRAAGGNVVRASGEPFLYGLKAPDFSVDSLVAYGGPVTEAIVMRALKDSESAGLSTGGDAKLFAQSTDQAFHEGCARFELAFFDPLIWLVRLQNGSWSADHDGKTRFLKQTSLRRIGRRVHRIVAG